MKEIRQMEPWVGEDEKEELIKTIESGWITEAHRTREFERVFASYVGCKYAVAVNNGTVSLAVALLALNIKPGEEVIVPDFTMIASANAIRLIGAVPVLVDVDPRTLCMDVAAAEAACTDRTRAIMPVHLNGRFPNMAELADLARRRDLAVLEDAAQALGSRCGKKHLGTFGHAGSFSFSTPKIITTGQGGMITTDDEQLAASVRRIKDFGRSDRSLDYYEVLGFNFKFTDLQSALGLAQMRKLPWRVERKKQMYALYRGLLKDVEQITFVSTDLEHTSPWFIDIMLDNRDALATYLRARGIGTRQFHPAIHTQPAYAHVKASFRNAESIALRGLWLPSSSFLTDDDIEYVCEKIRSYFGYPNH